MAKCKKNQWFAVVKDGDVVKDDNGLALMAKTKKNLLWAYENDTILDGKIITKIQFAKFTEI